MNPLECNSHLANEVVRAFPLGDLLDRG